jgi:hypothetical protein
VDVDPAGAMSFRGSFITPRPQPDPDSVNMEPPLELQQLDMDETSPASFFTNMWRYRGTVRVR